MELFDIPSIDGYGQAAELFAGVGDAEQPLAEQPIAETTSEKPPEETGLPVETPPLS